MFIKTSFYLCHDLVSFNLNPQQDLMSWSNCFNQLPSCYKGGGGGVRKMDESE